MGRGVYERLGFKVMRDVAMRLKLLSLNLLWVKCLIIHVMKKWNNIIFLVLSMLVVGCSDNDENPVGFYTSSGGDRIEGFSASVGESWLRAGGGSGVYKVSSSDESIVKAELSQEVITLKAYKVGQAEITIVDSREESATIEITVCPLIRTIEVMETRALYPLF